MYIQKIVRNKNTSSTVHRIWSVQHWYNESRKLETPRINYASTQVNSVNISGTRTKIHLAHHEVHST